MLDYTKKEYSDRKALVVNPAKTCQPIGAMYAALGINKCLPHSHGSQGCCSYHRMHLTRHYRDPIMASTSSFTEGACVFGGKANLSKGLQNIFSIYDPDIVAVNTTCLSETIGDDVGEIIRSTSIPEGKVVIHANTPSYAGSHVTGFANMVKAMVTYLAEPSEEKNETINIIPGYIEPCDMKEIKRILSLLKAPYIMYPDTSNVVNSPLTGKYEMYPKGGVTIDEIKKSGASRATIAMGEFSSKDGAYEIEAKCNVPAHIINVPMGIKATDEFIMKVLELTGGEVPYDLELERGQLVDLMVDVHNHYHGKKVALFGDPDIIIPMTELLLSLGMIPVHVLTGTPGKNFDTAVKKLMDEHGVEAETIKSKGDLMELHQLIKNSPVDMIIGNTYGKYIARAEEIPLVRVGFPILDRVGHSFFPLVGYMGMIRMIEKISTAFLEEADRTAADEDFELVM
jgi:nitrogenase molybdenum-iron protein beta chain